jgi:hypothetical protein
LIPLGELFSVKRNGKKKFRQYAMGNLLKEGKDFGETLFVNGVGRRPPLVLLSSSDLCKEN